MSSTAPPRPRYPEPEPKRLGSREQVEAVAARLGHGLSELAADIRSTMEATVPALRDEGTSRLLEMSVEQNVEAMLGMLAHGIDPAEVDPPSAAVEYARRLAQRGVSTFALIRAYRVGMARFLRRLIEDLVNHGEGADREAGRATLEMVDRVFTYLDRIIERLITTYAQAHEEWLDPNAILKARVRSVLSEKGLDLKTAQCQLGTYRIRQNHLSLLVWTDGAVEGDPLALLRRVTNEFATAAGCDEPPLFVPVDESSACAWLGLGTRATVTRDRLAAVLTATPGVDAAIGEPASGLAGFRRTHEQAVSAETVALVSHPPRERLTPYVDVAPIASMCSDLDAARAWVTETLGALAIDDEYHARFRETVRIFFANGGSYAATAKRIHLHRNTTLYRMRKAEEMRGRPFAEGRLEVELALLACHWFGAAVLAPSATREVRPIGLPERRAAS